MSRKKPKNWLDQRLTILTEIMNTDVNREWTVREIEQEMRKNATIQKFQPTYGKSTAYRDMLSLNGELSKKRKELAEGYIGTQLNITEELIDDLISEYNKLDEDSEEEYDEDSLSTVRRIKAKTEIARAINRLFVRQAAILPVDTPKRLEIDTHHRFSLEDYLELRQQAVGELDDPSIINGEFEVG